jgi:hypothetical protein
MKNPLGKKYNPLGINEKSASAKSTIRSAKMENPLSRNEKSLQ